MRLISSNGSFTKSKVNELFQLHLTNISTVVSPQWPSFIYFFSFHGIWFCKSYSENFNNNIQEFVIFYCQLIVLEFIKITQDIWLDFLLEWQSFWLWCWPDTAELRSNWFYFISRLTYIILIIMWTVNCQ